MKADSVSTLRSSAAPSHQSTKSLSSQLHLSCHVWKTTLNFLPKHSRDCPCLGLSFHISTAAYPSDLSHFRHDCANPSGTVYCSSETQAGIQKNDALLCVSDATKARLAWPIAQNLATWIVLIIICTVFDFLQTCARQERISTKGYRTRHGDTLVYSLGLRKKHMYEHD